MTTRTRFTSSHEGVQSSEGGESIPVAGRAGPGYGHMVPARWCQVKLSRSMSVGAGIGFVAGIVFAISSLFLYDESETGPGEVLATGLLIGLPITVVMGVIAGWLWDVFIRTK